MERSAELEAVTRRLFDALARGDAETVMAMWTAEEDTLWVGSDPNEWWSGRAEISLVVAAQIAETGGFPFRMERILAWTEGSVGWSCAELILDFDPPVPMRFTSVWHLELGQWKGVHGLTAVPATNEDAIGMTLTTSVDLVAQAVQVERPSLGSTAPDGTVTLLFTDIEGSTERNQVLGDDKWMGTLRLHHDLIREQVAANDGFEVKSMGDGFMIAFASARKALRCGADIQRAIEKETELDVRVRAGLHAGEAVREGDDFYGATVNMAARVAGQAAGGEVLASGLVKALVDSSGEFAFASPRRAELKAIAGTHELFPLTL